MKYVGAWLDGYRRYVQFDGRASRFGFWSYAIGNAIAPAVLSLLGWALSSNIPLYLAGAWFFITLLPTIAIAVRRLHDHHFSGWWMLIWFTGIGAIALLVGFALPGDPGPNRYGAQPGHRANTDNNLGAA